MFGGMRKRVVSLWFPRLASDRILRARPVEGPFALIITEKNAERIYCLNEAALRAGLERAMPLADARALRPDLLTMPADPEADSRFLTSLRRWALRWCPWVGPEGRDGLVLDITGAAHLWGGEAAMTGELRARLMRAGLFVRIGLGDTRGGAWALAHFREGAAAPGEAEKTLAPLPAAALRLEPDMAAALRRLGLRTIGDLTAAARAPLARRFGPKLLMRLDQALGAQPEDISPQNEPPWFGVRMSFPEPLGLEADIMAGVERLLARLCEKLKQHQTGALAFRLTLRLADGGAQHAELRLARPLHDPSRIMPLFSRTIGKIDAGFGIDQIRLEAAQTGPLPPEQISHVRGGAEGRLDDLISRIGARIGIENIRRFQPVDTHIPERSFSLAPAAFSAPPGRWKSARPRPLLIFPPEPLSAAGARPPAEFRWRRMLWAVMRATGPERILPEWWLRDENWRSGMRDYWCVETRQGRRLWLFYTPQNPGWFVQGEFP